MTIARETSERRTAGVCHEKYFKLGKASAAVVIFFALILVLTVLQWRVFRRRIHYTT